MDMLLKLLCDNARYTNEQLAVFTGLTVDEVAKKIKEYEDNGIIKGYKTLVNWEKVSEHDVVTALIEIRVSPRRETGFDEIAREIMLFDEVESIYLMSGGYDLAAIINARTFKDIALFVSQKLSPMPSVLSTATHFMLSRYKEMGVILSDQPTDERGSDFLA